MVKNGYSKILGTIFVIMVLAAIISGVYYWQSVNLPLPSFFPKTRHVSLVATYQDTQYNFSVNYPKKYILDVNGTQENYFKSGGQVQADISIPQSEFSKTNFSLAHITLAAKNQTTAVDCATFVTGANTSKKMTQTTNLPAGIFYTDEFDGAAAGTAYDTKLYRILHNDICLEASLTLSIANIDNYPPGTVTEVNQTDVWNDLTTILDTFKFTVNSSTSGTDSLGGTGTLQGRVDIGPNCPVEQVGNPCAPSPDAYEAVQIIVYTSDRATIVTKVNLDSTGNYNLDLDAGIYYVTYTSVYNFYQPPLKKITVTANLTTTQNFSIDTGIR